MWGGGNAPGVAAVDTIEYITVASLGDSIDFGDLTGRTKLACASGD